MARSISALTKAAAALNQCRFVSEVEMNRGRKRLIALSLPIAVYIVLAAQTVIDATGPVRKRLRNPTTGQAGSIGRKLPAQITAEVPPSPSKTENGTVTVTFILTNSGDKQLIIPVSPHPGDLEPKDKNTPYTVQHLYLYLSLTNDNQRVLPGGAHLYGNEAHPETLLRIQPGSSVRVLARVGLPPGSTAQEGHTASVVAHAVLDSEAMKTVHDQTFIDTQELGSATSAILSLQWQAAPQ